MQWALLLLFLSSAYAIGVSYYLLDKTNRLKYLAFFLASVTFCAATFSNLMDFLIVGQTAEAIIFYIIEWGHIYTIILILGALLLFIRESQPDISKFPKSYAALPVILIVSYLLVYNTETLKWWVLNIAEAGAILAAVIIYGMYSYYKSSYKTLLAASILFLITYVINFILPDSLNYIWQVLLSISVIVLFSGYLIVNK